MNRTLLKTLRYIASLMIVIMILLLVIPEGKFIPLKGTLALVMLWLFEITFFLLILEPKEIVSEDLEYIKDNLSKEQWKEYKNKLKKLNTAEKQIYTEELVEILKEKEELELEKFRDKTKLELSKCKIQKN